MTSSAQTPEPTDEQRAAAWRALFPNHPFDNWQHANVHQQADVESVARALAAAVTAEREKYLRVADELEGQQRAAVDLIQSRLRQGKAVGATMCQMVSDTYGYAARRIREVSR